MTKEERVKLSEYNRHKRIWAFCRGLPALIYSTRYGYKAFPAPRKLKGPYIVLSNHTAEYDPVFVGKSFRKQMYYVAGKNLYKNGFRAKFLKWAFGPIVEDPDASSEAIAVQILEKISEGKNVCIFPEGSRCYSGATGEIPEQLGKLIKKAGVTVVTYKIIGGYLTDPRWGYGIRKGKMSGRVINVYTKEKLENKSPEEIVKFVSADLYENAFERQKIENIRYKGKNKASGMEVALCVCPKCHQIDTIRTEGDNVYCQKCGEYTEIDDYGYFIEGYQFKTIYDWDLWQSNFFKNHIKEALDVNSSYPIVSLNRIQLNIVSNNHFQSSAGRGKLLMFIDRLAFVTEEQSIIIPIEKIKYMDVYEQNILEFSEEGGLQYETESDPYVNVRKFVFVWKELRQHYLQNTRFKL